MTDPSAQVTATHVTGPEAATLTGSRIAGSRLGALVEGCRPGRLVRPGRRRAGPGVRRLRTSSLSARSQNRRDCHRRPVSAWPTVNRHAGHLGELRLSEVCERGARSLAQPTGYVQASGRSPLTRRGPRRRTRGRATGLVPGTRTPSLMRTLQAPCDTSARSTRSPGPGRRRSARACLVAGCRRRSAHGRARRLLCTSAGPRQGQSSRNHATREASSP